MRVPDPKLAQALNDLGLTLASRQRIGTAPTYEAAKTTLDEVKKEAKRRFRELALELHPDRTGNDPEKAERFKSLAAAIAEIEELTVAPPRPVMRPMPFSPYVHLPNLHRGWASTTTSYTSATTTIFSGVVMFTFTSR